MSIYDEFFNLSGPCPESILDCSQLRQNYKEELDKLQNRGCSGCGLVQLKADFMTEVWKAYLAKLNV